MSTSSRPHSTGAWCLLGEALTSAHIAAAGFDWVCLDQQHGAFDDSRILEASRAIAAIAPETPIAVRLPSPEASGIGRALDAGARIVIAPLVDTPEIARSVVQAALYPPQGSRSWGPLSPLWGQGAPTSREANDAVEVWVMIETREAVAQSAQILDTPGVTGLFVGPYDLALSLGVELDQLLAEDPLLPALAAQASERGLRSGAFAGTPERAAQLHQLGFDTIAATTDTGIIGAGSSAARGTTGTARSTY